MEKKLDWHLFYAKYMVLVNVLVNMACILSF